MDTLLYALNAVLPLLLLIGLGYFLSHIGFLSQEFLAYANRFVFRIALPALLFYTIYSASGLEDIRWNVVIYSTVGVLLLFGLGIIIVMVGVKDNRQKGVILQGFYRSNMTIIGVPLADALGGEEAVLVVALVSMVVIPLYNMLSVIALTMFQKDENGQRIHWLKVIIKIMTNPLIISIALGIAVLFIRSWIPVSEVTGSPVFSIKEDVSFLYTFIKWVAQIASPLSLIVLGGGFQFTAVKILKREIILGVSLRVIVSPMIALTGAVVIASFVSFFNFVPSDYPALIATFASPIAVTSAIMAQEMGGDEKLAGQLVVWSSMISIVTIFIIVVILRSMALL
ncbi:MAG: AEC family transporter [Bacilli bacterium]|nr:AEC family transporter [Bacilli bacterium]